EQRYLAGAEIGEPYVGQRAAGVARYRGDADDGIIAAAARELEEGAAVIAFTNRNFDCRQHFGRLDICCVEALKESARPDAAAAGFGCDDEFRAERDAARRPLRRGI